MVTTQPLAPKHWDIFCKVVDNYGDIGVCWRLARQLADEHSFDVRLWVDRLDTFAFLCPGSSPTAERQLVDGIEICHWHDDFPAVEAADCVIEAFGCELPDCYVQAMVQRAIAPVWINLEYLSAEDWVEGCHRLPSLRTRGPIDKYFFFPGFTSRTGGLLRERDLLQERVAFDASAEARFWQSLGIPPRIHNELRISLFCYENANLPGLLQCWANGDQAITVFATPGPATDQLAAWIRPSLAISRTTANPIKRSQLTIHPLPFLTQPQYDRLLWSCDVNFIRGEDSFVRAQSAQRPFIWQPYPQSEGTHLVKMNAFLDRYLKGFTRPDAVRSLWNAWNSMSSDASHDISTAWADFIAQRANIEQHGAAWANSLDQLGDLAHNLVSFVREIYTGERSV